MYYTPLQLDAVCRPNNDKLTAMYASLTVGLTVSQWKEVRQNGCEITYLLILWKSVKAGIIAMIWQVIIDYTGALVVIIVRTVIGVTTCHIYLILSCLLKYSSERQLQMWMVSYYPTITCGLEIPGCRFQIWQVDIWEQLFLSLLADTSRSSLQFLLLKDILWYRLQNSNEM